MSTVTFDTLEFVKRLRDADVPEKQAEAQAEALRNVLAEQTKTQVEASTRAVADLDSKTEKAIAELKSELKFDIALIRKDMEALRKDLTIKMGSMFMVAVGILLAAMKFMS